MPKIALRFEKEAYLKARRNRLCLRLPKGLLYGALKAFKMQSFAKDCLGFLGRKDTVGEYAIRG